MHRTSAFLDDKILGLDKVAKFHYAPGMHEPVTVGEFIINKAKWDALPADLKEIVKVSVKASYWNHFVRFQEKTAKACLDMLTSGVKIIKTSDELNRSFLKAYDEIQASNVAKDDFYRKVIDSQNRVAESDSAGLSRVGRAATTWSSTAGRASRGMRPASR